MLVPGIGAFVGFVLGALIGNLFGRKKPKIPTANAEVYLDYTSDKFQLGASSAANGGNLDLVRNMAESARDTLNGFISVLAGDMPYQATSWGYGRWVNGGYISTPAGVQSFYGHTGGQLWVKLGSPSAQQQNVGSADDAVSKGVMWSIKQTQVIGGDIFAKRALANSAATDLTALLGDLRIAEDYRFYANNRELINGYITGAYNSLNQGEKDYYAANKAVIDKAHVKGVSALDANELGFYNANKATIDKIISALEDQAIANPWIITLQRINELKLDQWSQSDFHGGLQGFLTSMGIEAYGFHMESIGVGAAGSGLNLKVQGVHTTTDQDSSAAKIWRLYDAALDRAADIGGLKFYTQLLDQGESLEKVAGYFLNSAEFNGSGMTDSQFVTVMYQRALNRTPSQAELDYQTARLANGLTRAAYLVEAAESLEHRAITAAAIAAGLTVENGVGVFSLLPQSTEGGRSITIDDLSKIGYTKLTSGNTAGKDFLDFSAATAAVGWSDWREETTEGQWVWQGWGPEPEIPVMYPDPENPGNGQYVWVPGTSYAVTGGDDIVVGSRFGDYLAGAAGWDWIDGGDGDDTIEGGDGDDVLLGGGGRDRLVGGAGDDYLVGGAGDDHPWYGDSFGAGMWGGEGNDTIVFNGGIDGGFGENGDDLFLMEQDGYTPGLEASGNYDGNLTDYVDAGAGSDTISYERFTTPITAPLDPNFWPWATNSSAMPQGGINGVRVALWNHPTAWNNGDAYWADAKYIMGDWIKGVENVTGSKFNDYLWGDTGNNILKGGGGDDFLDGHWGDDILEGGAGADYMYGGGTGGDTLSYEGSNAGVFIDFTTGEAFGGHATGDRFNHMSHIRGSRFADELKGDANDNRIDGGGGDDWIVATKGNDAYVGGEGVDTVDFSEGFATGVATYQVWVDDGYWEWDDWEHRNVWIENGGHYETVTGTRLGLEVVGGVANWRATDGTAGSHSLNGVEHVIGTAGADTIILTSADEFITAGKGNDTLNGGGGSDTYYFNLGDGADVVTETNVGSNVLSFGEGIGFNQLTFSVVAGPGGHFTVHYSGSDSVRVNGALPNVKEGKLASPDDNTVKVLDMNGSGQLDVSQFEIYRGGSAGGDTIIGLRTLGDMIAGFGGNDVIYGMQPGQWSEWGDVIIGGAGDDTIYTATGDDQFAFERGSGRDTINDTGGDDTLVFGPNVAADDVIYKVIGADLYIGIAEAANPNLEAHQVTDYVRVVGGGVKWRDVYYGGESFNTVEFINAGGTWIDLRKLDINWTVQDVYNGGVLPIVFDLGGDGLDLTGVDASNVVSRLSSGELARTSWVGPTDGMLAYDRDGDGQINKLSEISFVQDKEGAKTDLEGLRGWDTNGDGKLNAQDEGWGKLKIWVDRNQNGRSTAGELRTLEEAGIVEIDLTGKATGNTAANNRDSFVHNTLSFTWSSGATGAAYDVQLARKLMSEYGLTADQVRAAWGQDRSADGELGRLILTPPPALAASVEMVRRGPRLNRFGPETLISLQDADDAPAAWSRTDFTPPAAPPKASADFSDHDDLYAEDEARWADVLAGRIQTGSGLTDEGVRASLEAFVGKSVRGGYGSAFGRPDIDDGVLDPITPLADTTEGGSARGVSGHGSGLSSDASRLAVSEGGTVWSASEADAFLADAAGLLAARSQTDDLWAPAEFSLAYADQAQAWWRTQDVGTTRFTDDLAQQIAPIDAGDGVWGGLSASDLSQHQKLTQALAAFGRDKGASAAVWKRSGEIGPDATDALTTAGGRWRFAGQARIPA
ncbi:DUF4214 domain-containing protein [Brevundimonas faecalis]|uniref:DUF4214 domain-containing protein n=1 Tax=Brevundimonas faecalis TaxID=947378 RepID=UPI00360B5A1A